MAGRHRGNHHVRVQIKGRDVDPLPLAPLWRDHESRSPPTAPACGWSQQQLHPQAGAVLTDAWIFCSAGTGSTGSPTATAGTRTAGRSCRTRQGWGSGMMIAAPPARRGSVRNKRIKFCQLFYWLRPCPAPSSFNMQNSTIYPSFTCTKSIVVSIIILQVSVLDRTKNISN